MTITSSASAFSDPVKPESDDRFKWRDYITISPNFNALQKNQLEGAFEQIARAHDGEGEKLIRAAAAKSKNNDILIASGKLPGLVDDEDGNKSVSLNIKALQGITYNERGIDKKISLNGTIVHELFHIADDDNKEVLSEKVMASLKSIKSPSGAPVVTDETFGKISSNYIIGGLTAEGKERQENAAAIRKNGASELADLIERTSSAQWRSHFEKEGITDSKGELLSEVRATDYTDAFMAKNAGNAEPQRSEYKNVKRSENNTPITIMPTLPFRSASQGYKNGPVNVTEVSPAEAGASFNDYMNRVPNALVPENLKISSLIPDDSICGLLKPAARMTANILAVLLILAVCQPRA